MPVRLPRLHSLLPVLCLTALVLPLWLSGCGGGGGGGGDLLPSTTLTGRAVDGYLYRARAFLDLNGNGRFDGGEPSTLTAQDGSFSITVTEAQAASAPVMVEVIPGQTVDQDDPSAPVLAMTLAAPVGMQTVVSPLTTLVKARMASGLPIDDARAAVAKDLAIPVALVLGDYVAAAGSADQAAAYRIAVSVARVLSDVEARSGPSASLAARYESLSTAVATTVLPRLAEIRATASTADARAIIETAIDEESATYEIGGSITGLGAAGLRLASAGQTLQPAAGQTRFAFADRLPLGSSYRVSIERHPQGQTCRIDHPAGQVMARADQGISVICQDTPATLSGSVSGLNASGLVLRNGAQTVQVLRLASSFSFPDMIPAGQSYQVTVDQQPGAQFCSIQGGTGTMQAQGANGVSVTCSDNAFRLGGSVRGLSAAGLILTNGVQDLTVPIGADAFEFESRLAFGVSYAVSVKRQPDGQVCSLADAVGTVGLADVRSIEVSCAAASRSYSVGGSAAGITGSGLVLRMGIEDLPISPGASSFRFAGALADGSRYAVSIQAQPLNSTCRLAQGSGTIAGSDVGNVQLVCRNQSLAVLSSNRLSFVDLTTGDLIRSLDLGLSPSAIAASPRSEWILVTESFERVLKLIDDSTYQQRAAIPVGRAPIALAIDAAGERAYVANQRDNTVSVVDLVGLQVVQTITVGASPSALYLSASRPHLYVVNRGEASVSVLHTGSLEVIQTFTGLGISPTAITAGSGESRLYLADPAARTLITLNLNTGVTSTRFIDGTPVGLARSPDGRTVYVLNSEADSLSLLDTTTGSLTTLAVGGNPEDLTVSTSGLEVYTADLVDPRGITVIDTRTAKVSRRIPLDFQPLRVWFR